MAIKAGILKSILSAASGFKMLDEAFHDYRLRAGLPTIPQGSENWVTALYDFLDDVRGCSAGYEAQGEDGFVVVSRRRRGSAGIADGAFPERIMPDDNRPKRERKSKTEKTPEELAKLAERENFVPGIAAVTAEHWNVKDMKAEAMRVTQAWFDAIGPGHKVNSIHLGHREILDSDGKTMVKVPGVWATVFIPNVDSGNTAEGDENPSDD